MEGFLPMGVPPVIVRSGRYRPLPSALPSPPKLHFVDSIKGVPQWIENGK